MNDFENKKKVNLAESGKNDQIRKKIYTLRTLRVKYWTLSYFQNRIYYGGNDYNSKISAIKPYKRANDNSVRKVFKSLHSDWSKADMSHMTEFLRIRLNQSESRSYFENRPKLDRR